MAEHANESMFQAELDAIKKLESQLSIRRNLINELRICTHAKLLIAPDDTLSDTDYLKCHYTPLQLLSPMREFHLEYTRSLVNNFTLSGEDLHDGFHMIETQSYEKPRPSKKNSKMKSLKQKIQKKSNVKQCNSRWVGLKHSNSEYGNSKNDTSKNEINHKIIENPNITLGCGDVMVIVDDYVRSSELTINLESIRAVVTDCLFTLRQAKDYDSHRYVLNNYIRVMEEIFISRKVRLDFHNLINEIHVKADIDDMMKTDYDFYTTLLKMTKIYLLLWDKYNGIESAGDLYHTEPDRYIDEIKQIYWTTLCTKNIQLIKYIFGLYPPLDTFVQFEKFCTGEFFTLPDEIIALFIELNPKVFKSNSNALIAFYRPYIKNKDYKMLHFYDNIGYSIPYIDQMLRVNKMRDHI